MIDLLIRNGFVITMDKERRIIPEGAVAIDRNRILDVDNTEKLNKKYVADRIIDAHGKAILPGLINTHTHLFQVLMKSLADDLALFDWWSNVIAPLSVHLEKDHCYYATLSGCLELIRTGCTCTMDNHYVQTGLIDECIRAFTDVGIRAIEAGGTVDVDRPYYQIPKELLMETKTAISENVRLIEKWNKAANGRINVWFGTDSPYDCTDEFLEKAHDLSKKYNVGVSCHLHESKDEVTQWKKETGFTPIQYYDRKIRFLDSNLVAVHCVVLDDEDVRILSTRDVKVSHNPVSNMYLANGISPVNRLLKSGITVSLGVDGPASNNNQDMFELMKTTALLHKVATHDPLAISAEKVLEMATIDGATCLGLDNEIGSLERGKKADIILINLMRSNMVPTNNVVSQLVYCGKGNNVSDVVIDGKIVMEGSVIKVLDENEIYRKTQEVCDDLVQKAGLENLRRRNWTSLPAKQSSTPGARFEYLS